MRRILLIGALTTFAAVTAEGQSPVPAATPAPTPSRQVQQPNRPSIPPINRSIYAPPGDFSRSHPLAQRNSVIQQYVLPLYRRPGGKELRELAPDPAIAARYGQLISRSDSGIFKLVPNAGCAEHAKVINASEQCLKYQFPGAANSFSFRTESYRIRHLADITYDAGSFLMPGIHMYGLMVDLGDIPLEQVSLQTPAVSYIAELKPTDDAVAAADMDKLANAGITREGHMYRRSLPVEAGHTYVSRSVAYRGRVMRSTFGVEYNEMDLDKRRDVITAFKVASLDPDGTVTIVWTRLASTGSPKLEIPKDENEN